jgi:hypothetical protein
MKRRIIDLSASELATMASDAWNAAAQEARSKGLPVTGSRDGRRVRYYPDGRMKDLGPVAPLPGEDTTVIRKKSSRKSVA